MGFSAFVERDDDGESFTINITDGRSDYMTHRCHSARDVRNFMRGFELAWRIRGRMLEQMQEETEWEGYEIVQDRSE